LADEIDKAIRDYLTGKLETKIQIRETALKSKVPAENIGGSKSYNHEAEQVRLLEKLETDPMLLRWRNQLAQVPNWLKSVDSITHDIIILHCRDELTWWQVHNEIGLSDKSARKRYVDFKNSIFRWTE
jgi:hypothetical protein